MRRAAALIGICLLSIACAAPTAASWTFPPDPSASAPTGLPEVAAASSAPTSSPSAVALEPAAGGGAEVAAAVAPSSASVSIADFAFGPSTVTIAAGGEVTWTNRDSERHSILVAGSESSRLETGAAYARTFGSAGRFAYACGLHPSMTGTVVVVEAGADVPVAPGGGATEPGSAPSTAEPTAAPTSSPDDDGDDDDGDDRSGHGGDDDDDDDHSGHGGGGDEDHSGPGGGGSGPG